MTAGGLQARETEPAPVTATEPAVTWATGESAAAVTPAAVTSPAGTAPAGTAPTTGPEGQAWGRPTDDRR